MIVLQAGIEAEQFLLWGETPTEAPVAVKPRGRKRKLPAADPSPYDPGDRLFQALEELFTAWVASIDKPQTVTAWLPTVQGKPVASSPLLAETPAADEQPDLVPWKVTAIPLAPSQVVDLLCACVGKETLAPGLIVGKTVAYWTSAMRFAGALVARQHFLPGVKEKDEGWRATWEPVFPGAEANRLGLLAKTMPAACCALTREAAAPPDKAALAVLSSFLAAMVDYLVRSSNSPLAPLTLAGRGRKQKAATFDSVHDQWVHALRSPDGVMAGAQAELTQLAQQVRDWQRPIAVSAAAPLRLCFRLEEPEANGDEGGNILPASGDWQVRYLLQAVDDPSLLVPAEEAWSAKGRQTALLNRGGFKAREYLLSSLGQAAGISPRIEDSLKTAAPGGYTLDATGAHEFLTEKAWLLEQAGFGVHLPAWWTRKGTKLRLTVRAHVKSPSMQGGSGLSLNEIIHFDWQVALGDQPLSLQELEALARLKSPLVKVRGQWVQLSAEEIQAALDFWKNKAAGQATVREVIRMALGATPSAGGIAFEGVTATGWIADFLAQLEGQASFEELPISDRFQGKLRPYQARGYSWLEFLRRRGLGACLADDMGLGKTVQALAFIQHDWCPDSGQPTLLICPTSVVGNWQKEAARFTPDLPILVHHGVTRAKGKAFQKEASRHALVLSSFALLHRDFDILKEVPWAGVILDEAQNIKNPETKQAKAARSLPAGYRIALTGTPVENHVGDLWSIMEFLNPGFLGTQAEFKRTFFYPIQGNHDADAAQRLKRLTGPFILRRLKTDKSIIADLPDKMEMKVFCTLTREQASLYAAVVQEAQKDIEKSEGIQRKGLVLATLSKLKQVCNHPAQFLGDNSAIPGRSGKLARLTEMLEEVLESGERALVFTQFSEMGAIIRRHLQETFGREVLFLHGGTPKNQRDRMVSRFQTEEHGPSVFVLSLKAGGTGLNLTGANHVFHFDRWWNPAVENQATDRAFRIGQTRNVQVHKYLCAGTLEERIDEMIERKHQVAAHIVGAGEGWLTELSTAELKELFALRKEALTE